MKPIFNRALRDQYWALNQRIDDLKSSDSPSLEVKKTIKTLKQERKRVVELDKKHLELAKLRALEGTKRWHVIHKIRIAELETELEK